MTFDRPRGLALTGPGFLFLLAVMSAPGCSGFFFHPDREMRPLPELQTVTRGDLWVTAPDGVRLHGWRFSPRVPPRGTVVFFHGNAENISTHVRSVLWLALAGYELLAVDYRGYGLSGGTPDLEGVHADALAVLEAAFSGEASGPIAVLGQSLGGAVAVYAVARSPHREEIRLLVLDSAFASYRSVAREKLAGAILTWPLQHPLSLLVEDRYSPDRWICRVSPVPVLVIHGTGDGVVPVDHSRRLHDLAREPKGLWLVRNAGHTAALGDPELRGQLLRILEERVAGTASYE